MRAGLALILCIVIGCASKHSSNGGAADDGGGGGGGGGNGDAGQVFGGGGGGDAATNQDGCSDDSRLVYVVSHEGGLYSFYPPTLEFKLIGLVQCPTGGAAPFSMAVDREGMAWVLHSDGSVWRVSTKDASCSASNYAQDQLNFHTFGMGFATDSSKSAKDTLYIDDLDGKGLATVDIATGTATTVGQFSGDLQGRNGELTGTGDGRLFGFFTTYPAQIAEIDKSSGAILSSVSLQDVSTGSDWAFSFWGGDFYLYTAHANGGLPQNDTGSDITRYRPSDKSVTVVKQNVGFRITGAGVSTCAPTTTPPVK
jgi:hypothetical protein